MGICDPGLLTPLEEATPEQMEYWEQYFINNIIKYPGRHLLEIGKPESGKTQFLYYCIDNFREYAPNEALLYFDIGRATKFYLFSIMAHTSGVSCHDRNIAGLRN
jgi:hypothetical protein